MFFLELFISKPFVRSGIINGKLSPYQLLVFWCRMSCRNVLLSYSHLHENAKESFYLPTMELLEYILVQVIYHNITSLGIPNCSTKQKKFTKNIISV